MPSLASISADSRFDRKAAGWPCVETSLDRYRGGLQADQRFARGRTETFLSHIQVVDSKFSQLV